MDTHLKFENIFFALIYTCNTIFLKLNNSLIRFDFNSFEFSMQALKFQNNNLV